MRARHCTAILVAIVLTVILMPPVITQPSGASNQLSYKAFSELAMIYQQGGQSSGLIAQLNQALQLMDEARLKLAQGNATAATSLNAQANAILASVLNKIPAAQLQATNNRMVVISFGILLVPIIVSISSLLFYTFVIAMRRYEKSRLFEMRIVKVDSDEAEA